MQFIKRKAHAVIKSDRQRLPAQPYRPVTNRLLLVCRVRYVGHVLARAWTQGVVLRCVCDRPNEHKLLANAPLTPSEKPFQHALVNVRQRVQMRDVHMLIDLVHGLANKAELDHRAIVLDETGVGCSARR
jgi:hypothetical protein